MNPHKTKASLPFPKSFWTTQQSTPQFPILEENQTTEIGIVGGGMVGIISAYLLAKAGKKVVLIEADRLINGVTGHTTAKVTAQHSLIYDELLQTLGEDKARQYYEANISGLEFIQQLIEELNINCAYETKNAFVYAETDKGRKKLEKEATAYQTLGIKGGLAKEKADLPFSIKEALVMYDQAQFDPVHFLTALVQEIVRLGGKIYEHTRATEVIKEKTPLILTENNSLILCQKVILATHYPLNDADGLYFTRLSIHRSYAMVMQGAEKIPEGMYINAEQPTRSIRSVQGDNGEPLLLVSGEGHQTGKSSNQTIFHYQDLEAFGKDRFAAQRPLYLWSSQDLQTLDKVPYIGQMTKQTDSILVATGFNKWGMSAGATAGKLLADLILGIENNFSVLFDPTRKKVNVADAQTFLTKNSSIAKDFVVGKLKQPDKMAAELMPDEGGLVEIHGEKVGAYRDAQSQLHQVSPVCTHLGCTLNWNDAERSWDCACHGSRFSYRGEILEGPAVKPLKQLD
ncbi:FAD-dependent oxidoreductase [Desemzia sp. RIT804]|uniref:FAD-dependent oxidoreductase n=1 Tax=Desemzia sp. RIT 804 TaxID=2810209 RepID=UPI0019502CE6|nr:FAD-dependent oxidoreductase [Desemzia sp. RIT 804]MBM6614756.1 FAD-dependent oxidoreductase [Desemzia sp. RIT 804]